MMAATLIPRVTTTASPERGCQPSAQVSTSVKYPHDLTNTSTCGRRCHVTPQLSGASVDSHQDRTIDQLILGINLMLGIMSSQLVTVSRAIKRSGQT